MFEKIKDAVKEDHVNTRVFNFSKQNPDVKLGFTLRTDIKAELVSFLELLKAAEQAVEEEIKK
jgi:hypothetical protein